MRKSGDDLATVRDIYYKGKNAFYNDANGNRTVISLAGLSLAADGVMEGDPLYNIYRNAFFDLGVENENDQPGYFDGHPVEEYANTLVFDLFELDSSRTETEAAIVLNVWMAAAHELHVVLQGCRSNNVDNMNGALDRAAALWIGADQSRGDNIEGHLLYNLAEIAGELFGQDNGEALINTELLKEINSIQRNIQAGSCAQEGGYVEMRDRIRRAISLMTVPLVQTMVHHIQNIQNEGSSDFVELYGLALLPRVAACDPAKYKTMLQWTVFNSLTVENKQNALDTLQSVYSCLDVTCADVGSYLNDAVPQCEDNVDLLPALAGYTPTTDVRAKSYIDRDLLQIRLLLEWQAYEAAKDYYLHGFNGVYSLAALATNQAGLATNEAFSKFESYYQSIGERSIHETILNVFDGLQPFNDNASNDQKVQVVMTILKSVVLYLTSVGEFEAAIAECERITANASSGSQRTVLELWDGGTAYFVGSIEGPASGGRESGGELLYAAAKTFCGTFGTCQPDNDASINKIIMESLAFGQKSLQNNNCEGAKTILHGTIEPALYVPLIQGTLYYASNSKDLANGIDSTDFASLYGYSRSVLPHLNEVYPDSATVLKQNSDFQLTSAPMPQGFDAVFNAFKNALPRMTTDCKSIGAIAANGGLCEDGVSSSPGATTQTPAPAPNTPPVSIDDIAFGRYEFSSREPVELDSLLSLDVRDVRTAGDIQKAETTYVRGSNVKQGLYGQVNLMSLSDISSQAHQYMSEDPIFNYFRYALYDESTFESTNKNASWPFADMVVRLALSPDHGNDIELAAEASVIMNVFFLIQHRLYRAARECKDGLNPSRLIDSSVALWIGREQQEGKFDSGWMLYSIAQQAAQNFGYSEGEAPVNTELMDLFNEAQVLADFCPSQPNSFLELRALSQKIIKAFSKALVQRLVYFMSEDDLDYTELYGLSIIPQGVSCDVKVYQDLKSALIDAFSRDTTIDDEFYEQMAALLSCMRITCDDLGDVSKASPHLQEIVTNVCNILNENKSSGQLAGYVPTNDVSQESRIDLDIRQISVFMKTRAYQAATEYYMYGANSLMNPTAFLSLQYLATSPDRSSIGDAYSKFTAYFGNKDNYADDIITSALRQAGDYENASRLQLEQIVVRTLQTMVSYMAVLSMLNTAVSACQNGEASQEPLDTAVAYFVGSLEGDDEGGLFGNYGELLFGLAKEQCPYFDTCTPSGDAQINELVMSGFASMQSQLASNDCTGAASTFDSLVQSMLPVSMIEGTLYYAAANEKLEARSTSKSVAAGSILASSVLPIVNAVNPDSARTISNNMAFDLDKRPVSEGKHAVFNAFARAVNQIGIDCNDVGVLRPESRGICQVQDDSDRPERDTPTNLGDDLYVSTTFVQDRANIAIDVKEMEEALRDGRQNFAKLIYDEGKNSEIYDENGMTTGHRSLGAFSLEETDNMPDEPLFILFVYALQDDDGLFMGKKAKYYADSIVKDSFNVKSLDAKTLASEAAVALNVWMYLAHTLYQALNDCKAGDLLGDDGIHAIDEAVAYWIGDGQISGNAERGHLLYALAEEMGEAFQIDVDGQARTNTNILRLFHQAKMELSFPDACTNDPGSFKRIYHIVNKITSQMAIPLIQALIHNLRQNDEARVKVYAHAVIPLFAACSPSTFTYLKNKLIHSSFNVIEVEPIVDRILEMLPCLGLQCDDIGVHKSEIEPSCTDAHTLTSLAGYKPASDVREVSRCWTSQQQSLYRILQFFSSAQPFRLLFSPHQFAQMDLDILEIDILMKMGAYGAAEDLYTNGKHAVSTDANSKGLTTSLSYLATSTGRSVVPQFDSFVRYYDGDEKYADSIIREAFANDEYDPETRRLLVVRNCQYMIMFMTALQSMHEAIGECEGGQEAASAEFWDKAAASIIGHLEGTENGGSTDGQLFFALAKQHCGAFGTCSSPSPALSLAAANNDKIVSLLYSGRGAVTSGSCSGIRKTSAEIEPFLLVPIIQATLSSSMNLMNSGVRQKALASGHVEGHVYASVILPLIEDIDRDAANTIETNLALTSSPFRDGLEAVFTAFAGVFEDLGVNCNQIGSMDGMDACSGSVQRLGTKTVTGISVGAGLFVLALCGIVALLRAKRKSAEKPSFITSNGELSHTDDLLIKPKEEIDDGPEGVNEYGEYPEEAALKPSRKNQEVV